MRRKRKKGGELAVLPALLSVPPSRSFAAWQRRETDDEGLRPSDHPWVAVFSFSERTRRKAKEAPPKKKKQQQLPRWRRWSGAPRWKQKKKKHGAHY